MVGVPGRSKACNTCRKRRIGCSLERPQCSQCIKSNRFCAGYQRERIFVTGPKILLKSQAGGLDSSAESQTLDKTTSLLIRNEDVYINKTTNDTPPPLPLLTEQIPLHSVLREQFLNEFICSFIPDAFRAAQERLPKDQTPWIMMLPELSTRTKALEMSIFAICAAKLGRLHDNSVMVKEALELYGRGLWELQKALWDPKLMFKDETLAACMALSMFEVLECPAGDGSGWVTHSQGCARLVQLRGPKAHCSALGHQLFLSARINLTMEALSQHRATYFSDPEWMSMPWKNILKSPFDRLFDILTVACQIYQQGDSISDLHSTASLALLLEVVSKCWKIDAQLLQLWDELETTTPRPLYWPEFSTQDNLADDAELGKVFPVAFQFPNLRIAHTCLLYWTLLMMLWSGLSFLYGALSTLPVEQDSTLSSGEVTPSPSPGTSTSSASQASSASNQHTIPPSHPSTSPPTTPLPPLCHRTNILPLARNICQSMEYNLQDSMRTMGPLASTFPLRIVIENLRSEAYATNYQRELKWALATMEKVNNSGARISRFLDKLGGKS